MVLWSISPNLYLKCITSYELLLTAENARKYIGAAIRSFERETCLRFVPKTKDVEDYIMFINQPG